MGNIIKEGTVKVVGIDLAKNVFHLHGIDASGEVVVRKKLSRTRLAKFMAKLPACRVGMEACGGSHFWAPRNRYCRWHYPRRTEYERLSRHPLRRGCRLGVLGCRRYCSSRPLSA